MRQTRGSLHLRRLSSLFVYAPSYLVGAFESSHSISSLLLLKRPCCELNMVCT